MPAHIQHPDPYFAFFEEILMTTQTIAATAARHYSSPAQQTTPDVKTWITRGANFVVAVTQAGAGAVLSRDDNPDEYMLYLVDTAGVIEAGKETIEAKADSLTIVPPGASRVTLSGAGQLVRVFSIKADDLAGAASNAAAYAAGAPDVAPLQLWPDPVGGFKLRNYRLGDYIKADSNMRIFRSTNLMINIMTSRSVARDVHKLSPHSHADFEQGSLALAGDWVHHMRYPWTADMTTWKEDEHIEMSSPSLLVIPPKVIHTSRNVNDGGASLVDIFAPPRMDFSIKPGMVCNAGDYPMPAKAGD
jgi:mannose-6-phosphate isomerase-like protein (cupin superfamily)